ncbi:MAG: FkbM family methyltransferase [Novosphingobium sp.]
MIRGLIYNADRAIAMAKSGYKRKRYDKQTEPFICSAEKGLRFELFPNEAIDRDIATYGIYERKLLHYLDARLAADAVMLDIGANIGNHALYLASAGRVIHCFEPNPSAWQRLERNIALNDRSNIHVHRFGLGDQDGTALFQENVSGNLGSSGFVADDVDVAAGYRTKTLPIRYADRAIAELQLPRIDFIKLDVEGLESKIIPALGEAIARHRPLIAFEYSGHLGSAADWRAIVDILPGYQILEPRFGPEEGTGSQMIWNLTHAGSPELRLMNRPENKWYECLFAEPASIP